MSVVQSFVLSPRYDGQMSGVQPAKPTKEPAFRVELVWGKEGGLGTRWAPDVVAGLVPGALPSPSEVEALYASAAAEPPLSEEPRFAQLFAQVYETSARNGQMLAAFVRRGKKLVSFAYGHFWTWEEQDYDWAHELNERLGDSAQKLEYTYALNLLARDPRTRGSGIGRSTLCAWLDEIGNYGCWLQTDDMSTPARKLYESVGFTAIGRGPDAPNGEPGLVMLRPAP